MSDVPAPGWYPDPSGRFGARYWDGQQWTAHVHGPDGTQVDPTWGTAPAGASDGSGAATQLGLSASGSNGALGLLGPFAGPRPRPRTADAVAATGGTLAVIGLIVLIGEIVWSDDPGAGEFFLIGVVTLAVAYAMAILGPGWLRPGAVPAAVIGPPALIATVFANSEGTTIQMVLFFLLVAAAWAAMSVAPGFAGAPVLVGGALLGLWFAALAMFTDSWSPEPTYDPWGTTQSDPWSDPASTVAAAGVVSLLFAVGAVIVAAWANSVGKHRFATPFLFVGALAGLTGLGALSEGGGAFEALLAFVVGAIFVWVGGSGARRGSLWFGAALGGIGLFALVVNLVDDGSAGSVLLLLVGAAVIIASPHVGARLGDRSTPEEVSEPTPI